MTYHQANIDRFSGFATCYDQCRPQLPAVIPEVLTRLAGGMPALVVDLGSGTGLSTRAWAGRTREVIGVEPNADMRRAAETQTVDMQNDTIIRYLDSHSAETGLPAGCADIVCCSQSFHWMEPAATLTEAARILRDGGVFAAIDHQWPPTLGMEAELAYHALNARIHELEQRHGIRDAIIHWPKSQHLANITASGHFRHTSEILAHQTESGTAERLIGLILSQGSVESLLKLGLNEDEIGLTAFRDTITRLLGQDAIPWHFSYFIRVGVK